VKLIELGTLEVAVTGRFGTGVAVWPYAAPIDATHKAAARSERGIRVVHLRRSDFLVLT
jgi:hypothetical protein